AQLWRFRRGLAAQVYRPPVTRTVGRQVTPLAVLVAPAPFRLPALPNTPSVAAEFEGLRRRGPCCSLRPNTSLPPSSWASTRRVRTVPLAKPYLPFGRILFAIRDTRLVSVRWFPWARCFNKCDPTGS